MKIWTKEKWHVFFAHPVDRETDKHGNTHHVEVILLL